ncbi:hypothetical protein KX729_11015 [Rhizobium sp. XQZ8]|uniref:hypothetical protein n=1 Tax=Rhizobium populisoli TaxID=2859785 RepID=UPI001CA55BA3|nr:hypothetical protein [Rhizobium populisoli]MBW6421974.1 hypothetical protein [Rhizobium populisoli]
MRYQIQRLILKNGNLLKEKDLESECPVLEADIAPVVGDTMEVTAFGRHFPVEVVWGNWPGREHDPAFVIRLRVKEI